MEFFTGDWLNAIVRLAHVVFGIGWIGASFYFMWLDANLARPSQPRAGVEGELWMVHSGGFYRVEKIHVSPAEMPSHLHWFKWEAAFTGITGFMMLCLVFYADASVYLIDPAKYDFTPVQAVFVGLMTLLGGWAAYEGLWRSPFGKQGGSKPLAVTFLLIAGIAWFLSQIFSGRGAFLHVGGLMGIIMSASVWTVIVPGQQQLIQATREGRKGDPAYAAAAKQRSVHNNYMTLPVVFIMLSGHYPSTFGHPLNWLVLILAALVAMAVNHWLNQHNRGQAKPWPLILAAVIFAPLYWMTTQGSGTAALKPGETPVAFAEVRAVIAERCTTCHASKPTDDTFKQPPNGVVFETPQQIRRNAQKINARVVLTQTMPPANKTEMKDEERALLGAWIAQGSRTD
jgi:uncharacterized membrane protein